MLSALRSTEVVADPTNVLALECAVRRRRLLGTDSRSRERVRLAASHRSVRGQVFGGPDTYPHFRLIGLCSAGRDQGSSTFESEALTEHVGYWLRLLRTFGLARYRSRVALTDLNLGAGILESPVLGALARHFPEAEVVLDPERTGGRAGTTSGRASRSTWSGLTEPCTRSETAASPPGRSNCSAIAKSAR